MAEICSTHNLKGTSDKVVFGANFRNLLKDFENLENSNSAKRLAGIVWSRLIEPHNFCVVKQINDWLTD